MMILARLKSTELMKRAGNAAEEPGFTLVELLALCVLVGLMALLVLPTAARAKQRAVQASCQSNLQQIGFALQTYADFNRDYLPGPVFALADPECRPSATNQLVYFLAGRLGFPARSNGASLAPLLVCPAQTMAGPSEPMALRRGSYILNEGRNGGKALSGAPFGSPIAPILPSMSLTAIAGCAPTATCFAVADADKGNVNATMAGWSALPYQPVHGKARNQLFFDWHVGSKPW